MKTSFIHFPKFLNECAEVLGEKMLKTRTFKMIQNESYVKTGVLGELIFQYHLHTLGLSYYTNGILQSEFCDKILKGADFLIFTEFGEVYVDVKTLLENQRLFLVNKRAFDYDSNVTHYTFIHIKSEDTAKAYTFSKKEVESWQVEKSFRKVDPACYKLNLNSLYL